MAATDPTPGDSAAEARTLVATRRAAALATLSEDGGPWASSVLYGVLEDGSPVLYVSTLAEHGRNLARDRRASIVVAEEAGDGDPLARGRVTLAGRVRSPAGEAEEAAARAAYLVAAPDAADFHGFGDFSFWILDVERVRWVGGYGRMETVEAVDYAAASSLV